MLRTRAQANVKKKKRTESQKQAERAYEQRNKERRREKSREYQARKRAEAVSLPPEEQAVYNTKKREYAATYREKERVPLLARRNTPGGSKRRANDDLLPRAGKLKRPEDYNEGYQEHQDRRNEWKRGERQRVIAKRENGGDNA
ncbi:hypothetical protein BDZ89DRAFT_1141928 [Hymenopellis radicata]|nr:hypothetical protein BDZ89DRAFT_1141928 [Hymenopellis radicata]